MFQTFQRPCMTKMKWDEIKNKNKQIKSKNKLVYNTASVVLLLFDAFSLNT